MFPIFEITTVCLPKWAFFASFRHLQEIHWSKLLCGMFGFSAKSSVTTLNILQLSIRFIKTKNKIISLHPVQRTKVDIKTTLAYANRTSSFFVSCLQVNLCQKLFFLQNLGRTCCVQKMFWMSETISVHNMYSPGLSLEFSCIELVIQWKICFHIVA